MADIAKLGFSVDSRGLLKGESALDSYARKGEQTEKRIDKSVKNINNDFLTLNKTIGLVAASLVALGGVELTKDLVRYTDTWKGINSQIRQVTDSESELISVRESLLRVSLETRSELEGTVKLFAEMKRSTDNLGISTEKQIEITKTMNNLFISGGRPLSEINGAIRQLSQGFAAGALRGDEFNSVAENAPRIMDALGRTLKMTRGELREFAATGGITAQIMIQALDDYKDTAQKLADQTEKTFAQNMQNAQTNVIEFVGQASALNDIIGITGEGISSLSEDLDSLTDAGQVFVGVLALGLTPSMMGYLKSLVSVTAAQLTAGTTAIKTANAFGTVTTTAATATVATNALSMATKVLLGPWGLLITAVGAATAVFIASSEASEEAEKQHVRHANSMEALAKEYEKYSKGRLGAAYVDAQRQAIKIDIERAKVTEQLNEAIKNIGTGKFDGMAVSTSMQIDDLQGKLSKLNAESKKQERIMSAVNKVFQDGIPLKSEMTTVEDDLAKKVVKVNSAFEKQIVALAMQHSQLSMTKDEYELYAATQEAVANKSTPAMIEAIRAQVKVNQELRKELEKTDPQIMKDLTKEVENFGGAWTKTGSVVVDAFGDMSSAISDYMSRMEGVGELEDKLADRRKVLGRDNIEVIKLEQQINDERVSAELAGMKSIASATGSLFDEKTAAAKAFAALNQVLTVAEIALSFQKMAASTAETGVHVANETTKQGANALTAITSSFAAPFPINFAAGAAMIGIMSGLLGSVFGGGGSSVDPSEALQESQGTGTVLGSSDKSASISESQARFEDLQIDQLAELRGIRDSITDLSSGIAQLATSIIGGSGIGDFAGSLEGSDFTSGGIGGFLNDTLGKFDPSGLISGILSAFSSTKRTIIDSGIAFISQSLGEIIDEGIIQAQAFFTIETKKKKWFGLSKSSSTGDEFQSIDSALNEQIGAIFTNIGDTVIQSAELLGFTTADVTRTIANDTASVLEDLASQLSSGYLTGVVVDFKNFEDQIIEMSGFTTETVTLSLREALNEFEVDVGKISLEGLSGEEIQKELEAVFSKQADLIAEFIVPSIKEYQQIGEGLFDTLTRVSKEQVIFNSSIEKMGFDLSGLANTIQIDIAQSVIALSGGVNKFNDSTNSFFDNFFSKSEKLEFMQQSLSSNFDSLGLSMVTTKEGFKSLIEGIDITTEEGQRLLASLLEITPALSDYIDELERIEQKRANMTIELLKLQGKAEEALAMERELELAALDGSLRALQLLIFAEEDRISLLKEQEDAVRESFSMLEKAVKLEKSRAQAVFDVAKEAHEAEISRINDLRSELEAEKKIRDGNLANAESALNKAFDAEINRIQSAANEEAKVKSDLASAEIDIIKTVSSERISALNDEKSELNSTASAMRALVNSVSSAIGVSKGTDLVSALALARSGDLSKASNLDFAALSKLEPSSFSSAEDLAVQTAINQNRLKEIGDIAGRELTETERQLAAIDRQINLEGINSERQILAIKDSSNSQIESINKNAQDQIAELESQRNSLLGIDNSVLSVEDAVNQFKTAQSALDELNYDREIAKLDMLVNSANNVFALHEQAYADEIERLDKILEDNEALLNAALGIDNSVMSVSDAIASLNSSIMTLADSNSQQDVTIPPPPPTNDSESSRGTNSDETTSELKKMREDNVMFQRELVKNTKTTANILQRFELDGLDTRSIN